MKRLAYAVAAVAALAVGVTTIAVLSPRFGIGSDPTPSRFVGEWASTDHNDHFGAEDSSIQTMTIRAGEDGVLQITVRDESSHMCSLTPQTMTGTGRLDDPSTLVVPSPILACADGSDPTGDGPSLETATSSYTLVLDLATDRLYDNREVVWTRGAPPESWLGPSTDGAARGSGTYAILHGEVTFRAAAPWNDHGEAYMDPRVFFLLAGEEAEITILVNPMPPEAPCENLSVPPSAEELVDAIRSNPDLEATVPVSDRVGGIDALRMDVVAAPGGSIGPCGAVDVDVVTVPGRPWGGIELGGRGRLYVLDLPGGSARTLAILIKAPDADLHPSLFQWALDAAVPVLDSFEFHAP